MKFLFELGIVKIQFFMLTFLLSIELITSPARAVPLEKPLTKVSVQLKWVHKYQFAGYYAAEELGYYRDEGLSVELIEGAPDRRPVDRVLAGEVEFAISDVGVLLSRLQGEPLVLIAAIFQHAPDVFITLKESGLATPCHLIGRRVMVKLDDGHNASAIMLQAMLMKEGMSPEKVHLVPHAYNFEALLAGEVDGASAYVTDLLQLQQKGRDFYEISPMDYGVDFYNDILFTSEDFLARNPEQVAAFRRATLKGWSYAMANIESMATKIARYPAIKRQGLAEEDLIAEAMILNRYILLDRTQIGHLNQGRLEMIARTFHELGLVASVDRLEGAIFDVNAQRQKQLRQLRLAGYGTIIFFILLAGTAIWIFFLRRTVIRRTRELLLASEELQKKHELISSIMATSPVGILKVDANKRISFVNSYVEKLFGLSENDLATRLYDDEAGCLMLPEGSLCIGKDHPLCNVMKLGQPVENAQLLIKRQDGGSRYLAVNATPVFSAHSEKDGMVVVIEDITERKSNEVSMRLQSRMLDAVGQGVVATDLNGMIIYWNKVATSLYGWQSHEVVNCKTVFDILASEMPKDAGVKALNAVIGGEVQSGEFPMHCKHGRAMFVRITASPIYDEYDDVVGVLGISTDLTDHMRREEDLRKAKEEADNANRVKTQFLANMSHEIRTPMNAIIGMTDLVLMTEVTEKQRKYLSHVKGGSQRLLALINDILDLSKIESEMFELVYAPLRLAHLINEKIDMQRLLIKDKPIVIESEIDESLSEVLIGDALRLGQVVNNLLGNAIKFTECGEVRLIVTARERSASHLKVDFSIIDTGIGIAKDKISRLFAVFSQLEDPLTKRFGGTGLGLAISKSLVEKMGGEITVKSEPGKGSTFSFTANFELADKP